MGLLCLTFSVRDVDSNSLEIKEYLDQRGALGRTALHLAANNGHYQTVEILVMAGADLNAKDLTEATPLSLATEKGRQRIFKFLVEKGANPNQQGTRGWTSLYKA